MFTNKLHNMNELIKAASEDRYPTKDVVLPLKQERTTLQRDYIENAEHFLAYAKSQGFEMVSVKSNNWQEVYKAMWDSNSFDDKFTRNLTAGYFFQQGFKQALAIGKAQGVKEMGEFAEWARVDLWEYNPSINKWQDNTVISDPKTTAELIEIYQNRKV